MKCLVYQTCEKKQKCSAYLHMYAYVCHITLFMFRLEDKNCEHPTCSCGLHVAVGRTRIGAMNDADRNSKYVSVLREHVTSDSICLCLSDGSLLGPLAAQLGAKKVYCIDGNSLTRHVIQDYVKHNNLQDRVVILSNVQHLEALMEPHDKVQY
jgi:acetone carboxylase gamma subunit